MVPIKQVYRNPPRNTSNVQGIILAMAVAENPSNEVQYYYLAPGVPENWLAIQRLVEHIRGQLGIAQSINVQIDASYISASYRPNTQDDFVVFIPEALNGLLQEIAYVVGAHAAPNQNPVPESAIPLLKEVQEPFSASNTNADLAVLRQKAETLVSAVAATTNNTEQPRPDEDEEEVRRKKKKTEEKNKDTDKEADEAGNIAPVATATAQTDKLPTSPDTKIVSQLIAEQQELAPGGQLATETQVGRNVDTRPLYKLVQDAAANGASYTRASISLRNRLLDSFLSGEIAATGLNISVEQLRAENPQLYAKMGSEFTGTIESFLRSKSWENPEYLKLLASPEGMLQVMSDLNGIRLTPNAIPAFANWEFTVKVDLQRLANGQVAQKEQIKVDLGSDTATAPSSESAAATTETAIPSASQQLEKTAPALSAPEAEVLSSEASRQLKGQAVSPLKAFGLDPIHEEKITQSFMLAAHFGINPEEAAGLSSEYWPIVFGIPKPSGLSNEEIFAVLKHEAWNANKDVVPISVQGIPIGSFPIQNRQIYWFQANTETLRAENDGIPAYRIKDILENAVRPNVENPVLTPSESVQTAQLQQRFITIAARPLKTDAQGKPDYAAEAADAADQLHTEQRREILYMMQTVTVLPAEASNNQLMVFEQNYANNVDTFIEDVAIGTFDFSDEDYEETFEVDSAGNPKKSLLSRVVDNRLKARAKAKKAADAAKKAATTGAKVAGKSSVKKGGEALSAAASKIPFVGAPLAGLIKVLTDEDLQKMVGAAIGGTIAAFMGLLSQLAGAGQLAAIAGGGLAGAGIGFVIGNVPGAIIGGLIGGGGTAFLTSLFRGGGGSGSAVSSGATLPVATTPPLNPVTAATKAVVASIQTPAFVGVAGMAGVVTIGTLFTQTAILDSFLTDIPISGEEYSKYLVAVKTATPTQVENNTPTQVQYHITIAPRENYTIEVVNATDTWKGLPSGQKLDVQPPQQDMAILGGVVINPRETKAIDYTWTVSGEDVLLTNTFDMTFRVQQDGVELSTNEHVKVTTSVRIGNPKLGCIEFKDDIISIPDAQAGNPHSMAWPENDKNIVLEAFTKRLVTNGTYLDMLCKGGNISLYRANSRELRFDGKAYGGVRFGKSIALYDVNFTSQSAVAVTEYTIAHEFGHMIDGNNPGLRQQFNFIKIGACYTYPLTGPKGCPDTEAFAEAIADFVVYSNYTFWALPGGKFEFKTKYPVDFNWIKDNIFGGKECGPSSCNE